MACQHFWGDAAVSEVHRAMIVPASLAPVARAVAAALSPAGHGMFVSELCPSSGPADADPTHYVSTGMIGAQFADLLALSDAQALHDAAVAGAQVQGLPVTWTVGDCAALLSASDVSEEPPFDALARLGLQLVQPDDEP